MRLPAHGLFQVRGGGGGTVLWPLENLVSKTRRTVHISFKGMVDKHVLHRGWLGIDDSAWCSSSLSPMQQVVRAAVLCKQLTANGYYGRWNKCIHSASQIRRQLATQALADSKAVQMHLSQLFAISSESSGNSHSSISRRFGPALSDLAKHVPSLVDDRCIAQIVRAAVVNQHRLSEEEMKCLEVFVHNLTGARVPKQLNALASIAHSLMALSRVRLLSSNNVSTLLQPVLRAACSQNHSKQAPPLRAMSTLLLASSSCHIPATQLWAAIPGALPARLSPADLKPLCNALHAASQVGAAGSDGPAFLQARAALVAAAEAAVHQIPPAEWPIHSAVSMASSLVSPPRLGPPPCSSAIDTACTLLQLVQERVAEASPSHLVRAAVTECRVAQVLSPGRASLAHLPLLEAAALAAASAKPREAAHLSAVLLHEAAKCSPALGVPVISQSLQALRAPLPTFLGDMSGRDLPLAVQALHTLAQLGAAPEEQAAIAGAAISALDTAKPHVSDTSVLFCVRALAPIAPLNCLAQLSHKLHAVCQRMPATPAVSQQLLVLHSMAALGVAPPLCEEEQTAHAESPMHALGTTLARRVREQNKSPDSSPRRLVSATELLQAAEGLLAAQAQQAAARVMRAAVAGQQAPLGAKLLQGGGGVPAAPLLAHAAGALAACLPSDSRLMAAVTARALQALHPGGGASPLTPLQATAAAERLQAEALGDLVLAMCVTGTLSGRLRLSANATGRPVAHAALARWLALQHAAAGEARGELSELLQLGSNKHLDDSTVQQHAQSFLDEMGLFPAVAPAAAVEAPDDICENVLTATGDVLPLGIPAQKVGIFYVASKDCCVPPGPQGAVVFEAARRLKCMHPWSVAEQLDWLGKQLKQLQTAVPAVKSEDSSALQLYLEHSLHHSLKQEDASEPLPAVSFLQAAAPAHPRTVARLAALHAQGWVLLPLSEWEVAAALQTGAARKLAASCRQELQAMAQRQAWGS